MKMLYPWLGGYFGIGAAVFLGYYLYNERPWKNDKKYRSKILELVRYPNGKPLREKLLGPVVFAIAVLLALILWPVFAVIEMKNKIQEKRMEAISNEPNFSANKGNLKKLMDICEIETEELVSDPLNAAPNLPFGHLNGAWEAFKGKCIEGDEIWSFSTDMVAESELRAVRWGQLAEGYALLRKGKVVAEFYSHGG